jgi:hypothetical protein
MELEDLLLKYYRVEKINGRMVATEDDDGHYRASSADDVEAALTTGERRALVDVRVGWSRQWRPLMGGGRGGKQRQRKAQHQKDYQAGYQAGYKAGRLLAP